MEFYTGVRDSLYLARPTAGSKCKKCYRFIRVVLLPFL